jgi:hypothetical protein
MSSSIRSARAEYWRGLLDQFDQSGQTVQAFCTERAVSVPSFYQWKRRLRGGDAVTAPGIVRVKFLPAAPREVAATIQIVTPNGFVVRVDSSMPTEALAQLLRALASSTERGGVC